MNITLKRILLFGVPSILGIIGLIVYSEKEYKKELEEAKHYRDLMHENCEILGRVFKSMEETDQVRNETIKIQKEIDRLLNLN